MPIKTTHMMLCAALFLCSVSRADDKALEQAFAAGESGDYPTALAKLQPLAAAGNALAQFNLALMYHGGLGVAANEAEAVKWYQKSAQNGYPQAQEFLAAAYAEGWFGLPRDEKLAAYWQSRLDARER